MKTKTYIGTVNERNGDMQYSDVFLFETRGSPDLRLEKITSSWRGLKMRYDSHSGGYWSDHTLISPGGHRLVDQIDVPSLKKYLNTL